MRHKNLVFALAAIAFWVASLQFTTTTAHADPPPQIPVAGHLVDSAGTPIDGDTTMQVRLYDTADVQVYSETRVVPVAQGNFAFLIGIDSNASLDLDALIAAAPVKLGITVANSAELTYPLGTVPYAAQAQHAITADSASSVSWSAVQGAPTGLADGDNDTTYTAGSGVSLSASNQFSLDTTFGDARYVNEGQADSVTSAMVTDGTVTPDDIAPNRGIVRSRSDIYLREGSATIAAGTCGSGTVAQAFCDDFDDIPLGGGCTGDATSLIHFSNYPLAWNDLAAKPGWNCGGCNPESFDQVITAHVYCTTVTP